MFLYIVDSKYLPWTSWSDCSVSCGPGTRVRNRICQPSFGGGEECPNDFESENEACMLDKCFSK